MKLARVLQVLQGRPSLWGYESRILRRSGRVRGGHCKHDCAKTTTSEPRRRRLRAGGGSHRLQMLFEYGQAKSGQTVLILGAAGNVGAYAVQLAATAGLHVIAGVRSKDTDYVRSLGAEKVVDITSRIGANLHTPRKNASLLLFKFW